MAFATRGVQRKDFCNESIEPVYSRLPLNHCTDLHHGGTHECLGLEHLGVEWLSTADPHSSPLQFGFEH